MYIVRKKWASLLSKSLGVILIPAVMAASTCWSATGLEFGLKSGVTTLNVYGDLDAGPVRFRTGTCGGAFVAWAINSNVTLQGEIDLSSRAYRRQYQVTFIGGITNVTEVDRLTYFEFPVLMKFPFPSGSGTHVNPYIGLQGAIKVNARAKGDYVSAFGEGNKSFSMKISNAKSFDIEPLVGVDLSCKVAKRVAMHFDLRMWYGLRTLYHDDRTLYTGQQSGLPVVDYSSGIAPEQKSTGLSLTLGLGWI